MGKDYSKMFEKDFICVREASIAIPYQQDNALLSNSLLLRLTILGFDPSEKSCFNIEMQRSGRSSINSGDCILRPQSRKLDLGLILRIPLPAYPYFSLRFGL